MFPSSRAADSSPFDFILKSLNVMHVRIQRGGGGGGRGSGPPSLVNHKFYQIL